MAGKSISDDEDGGAITDINVTPLVDVVLVLLIVFMITVPAIVGNSPVKVNLPETSAYSTAGEELPMNVFLKRESGGEFGLYLNSNRIELASFRQHLTDMHPSKDQAVNISADKDIPYEQVVNVMDVLAQIGITKSLATNQTCRSLTARLKKACPSYAQSPLHCARRFQMRYSLPRLHSQ